MTSILLIDDDVEFVALLANYLRRESFDIAAAHDGETGVYKALSGAHDIVVLDVMMPRMNGIEALRRIRLKSEIPALMLTARGDDLDRIVGLELGADDYVAKPCTPRELTARVRAIVRRTEVRREPARESDTVRHECLALGPLTLWPGQRRVEWSQREVKLTSSEYELLEVLARNAGRTVNKSELSIQALGRALGKFDRTVDVHLSSIRKKLGTLPDGRSCIQTVFRKGYQLVER